MNYKLLTAFIVTFLIVIIISCGEKTSSGPDTVTPPDTHAVGMPKNIKIDSLRILDTVHTIQILDTLNNTIYDTTIDTVMGSFVARWDTVANAARYYIFVHYKNGDFIRAQVADTTRRVFIGGLKPDNSYFIKIAALRYVTDTFPDTIINDTVVGKKSDSVSAELFFPLPPKRIFASAAGGFAFISWTPSLSPYILGYDVCLADAQNPDTTQKLAVDSATTAVNFPAGTDRVYKVHVVTRTKIGGSPVCSSFVYDINNLQDAGFKLPYIYLSTYTRPDESNAPSTVLGAGYMVGVKGGIFAMGNIWSDTTAIDRGKPVHEVVVSSFYLGSREISNALYVKFLNDFDTSLTVSVDTIITTADTLYINKYFVNGTILLKQEGPIYFDTTIKKFAVRGDTVSYPIIGVYWEGAALFCNWLSTQDRLDECYDTSTWHCDTAADGYRLPTEAEFEYAHSAAFLGTKQRFPWGYIDDVSKYCPNPKNLRKIGELGQFLGFYDMSGNALEWCNDFSDSLYYDVCLKQGIVYNPTGPDAGVERLLRGGCYKLTGAQSCSIWRHDFSGVYFSTYGFRVARNSK